MDTGIKRVQVPLDKVHRDVLRDLTTEYEKWIDQEVGFAKVAAILLRRVLDSNHLSQLLLYEIDDETENGNDKPTYLGGGDVSSNRFPKDLGRREAA